MLCTGCPDTEDGSSTRGLQGGRHAGAPVVCHACAVYQQEGQWEEDEVVSLLREPKQVLVVSPRIYCCDKPANQTSSKRFARWSVSTEQG